MISARGSVWIPLDSAKETFHHSNLQPRYVPGLFLQWPVATYPNSAFMWNSDWKSNPPQKPPFCVKISRFFLVLCPVEYCTAWDSTDIPLVRCLDAWSCWFSWIPGGHWILINIPANKRLQCTCALSNAILFGTHDWISVELSLGIWNLSRWHWPVLNSYLLFHAFKDEVRIR